MISSLAIWLTAYDIELNPPSNGGKHKFEADKRYFGFGTMPPKGKIAARIRRRRWWEEA
jgi:hypothetical protein